MAASALDQELRQLFRSMVWREYAGGDVRFELPVRPLGWGRLIGPFLIGFGRLFLWSPACDGAHLSFLRG